MDQTSAQLNVMVLAAGKGTRMKSDIPKVCTEVLERSLIGWVIDAVKDLPIHRLCFVVGFEKERVEASVREHLEANAPDLRSSVVFAEQKVQLGTGHALQSGWVHLNQDGVPLMVLCGDTPLLQPTTLKSLYEEHVSSNALATMATSVIDTPFGYGRAIGSRKLLRNVMRHQLRKISPRLIQASICLDRIF